MSDPFRIDLNSEEVSDAGPADWADMMSELEDMEKARHPAAPRTATAPQPPKAAPAPAAAPPAVASPCQPDRPLTRYEELCRTPSMSMAAADLTVMTDFSNIIGKFTEIGAMVERLRTEHPGFVPDRFLNLWCSNVKEASQVMMREFQQMRHGRQQKKYDARHVCKQCQGVFMVALPGGVCDECRAACMPRQKPAE